MDALELVTRYFAEVSNEPDASRRSAAIEELFAEDLHYVDQDGPIEGRVAFAARIDELAAMMSVGARFSPRREPRQAGEAIVYDWRLGRSGETASLTGTDIAIIDDGKIARLYAVVD